MPVGPQRGYEQEHGHSGKQKGTCPKVIVFITEEKVHDHDGYVGKPQHVGNNKYLTERNVVVKCNMNHLIMTYHGLFKMSKLG